MNRCLISFLSFIAATITKSDAAELSIKLDVLPILVVNCFQCNGFDKAQRHARRDYFVTALAGNVVKGVLS